MSFEEYGNKLINLLSKIEKKLNPSEVQIGGGDGPISTSTDNSYVKIVSYSVNHVSVLVHIGKNGTVEKLENPQISYQIGDSKVEEYSIEQQLRLGCDNNGHLYKYSVVLTRHPKKDAQASGVASGVASGELSEASNVRGELSEVSPRTAFGELAGALGNFANAATSNPSTGGIVNNFVN